jgi:hypothetical protein
MDSSILIMFAAIIIIGASLLAIITLGKNRPRVLNQQQYRESWLAIEQSLTRDQGSLQLAIINSDKLLDKALRERGMRGQTMGDRLKSAKNLFKNNNNIWGAHKVRNQIAHESGYQLSPERTRQVLKAFKQGLIDLGAL